MTEQKQQDPQGMFEGLAAFMETAPQNIKQAWELDQRAYAATLDLLLAEKRAHKETAERAAQLSEIYKSIQSEIRETVCTTLGYDQLCTATHAVRRLAQRFNELQSAARQIADWNNNDTSKDNLDLLPAHLGDLMRATCAASATPCNEQ